MIASVAGDCVYAQHKETDKVRSPGVKYGHYMPRAETARFAAEDWKTALKYYDKQKQSGRNPVLLIENSLKDEVGERNVIFLGEDAKEMAANLFYDLRAAERASDLIVVVEPRGKGGVYDGVMNRLTKAAKKFDG